MSLNPSAACGSLPECLRSKPNVCERSVPLPPEPPQKDSGQTSVGHGWATSSATLTLNSLISAGVGSSGVSEVDACHSQILHPMAFPLSLPLNTVANSTAGMPVSHAEGASVGPCNRSSCSPPVQASDTLSQGALLSSGPHFSFTEVCGAELEQARAAMVLRRHSSLTVSGRISSHTTQPLLQARSELYAEGGAGEASVGVSKGLLSREGGESTSREVGGCSRGEEEGRQEEADGEEENGVKEENVLPWLSYSSGDGRQLEEADVLSDDTMVDMLTGRGRDEGSNEGSKEGAKRGRSDLNKRMGEEEGEADSRQVGQPWKRQRIEEGLPSSLSLPKPRDPVQGSFQGWLHSMSRRNEESLNLPTVPATESGRGGGVGWLGRAWPLPPTPPLPASCKPYYTPSVPVVMETTWEGDGGADRSGPSARVSGEVAAADEQHAMVPVHVQQAGQGSAGSASGGVAQLAVRDVFNQSISLAVTLPGCSASTNAADAASYALSPRSHWQRSSSSGSGFMERLLKLSAPPSAQLPASTPVPATPGPAGPLPGSVQLRSALPTSSGLMRSCSDGGGVGVLLRGNQQLQEQHGHWIGRLMLPPAARAGQDHTNHSHSQAGAAHVSKAEAGAEAATGGLGSLGYGRAKGPTRGQGTCSGEGSDKSRHSRSRSSHHCDTKVGEERDVHRKVGVRVGAWGHGQSAGHAAAPWLPLPHSHSLPAKTPSLSASGALVSSVLTWRAQSARVMEDGVWVGRGKQQQQGEEGEGEEVLSNSRQGKCSASLASRLAELGHLALGARAPKGQVACGPSCAFCGLPGHTVQLCAETTDRELTVVLERSERRQKQQQQQPQIGRHGGDSAAAFCLLCLRLGHWGADCGMQEEQEGNVGQAGGNGAYGKDECSARVASSGADSSGMRSVSTAGVGNRWE